MSPTFSSAQPPRTASPRVTEVKEERLYESSLPVGFVVGMFVLAALVLCALAIWLLHCKTLRRGSQIHAETKEITDEKLSRELKTEKWDGGHELLKGNTECSLCSKSFQLGEDICKSDNEKCQHVYHESCIAKWLQLQNTCPTCNMAYMEEVV